MKALHKLFIASLYILVTISCQDRLTEEDVLGTWEIVTTESRGQKVSSSSYLVLEQIQLLADGSFRSIGRDSEGIGKWKFSGHKLLLHSPGAKDLNGKQLTPERSSEWYVFATDGWMHWEGTSRFSHQHIKITLKAQPYPDNPLIGLWLLNDSSAELKIIENQVFEYTASNSSFTGTWLSDTISLTLISDESPASGSKRTMRLKRSDLRLYPESAGSDYYFEKANLE